MEPFSTEAVTLIEEVFPQDTNSYGTLFGGRLMGMMDKAAGIVSSKFAHREFVTVSIDTMQFKSPARQGDLIEVVGRVVFTSTHTAACKVNAYAMSKADWSRKEICSGYFFMVAIDNQMRPIPIPQLTPSSDEEKEEWAEAEGIRKDRGYFEVLIFHNSIVVPSIPIKGLPLVSMTTSVPMAFNTSTFRLLVGDVTDSIWRIPNPSGNPGWPCTNEAGKPSTVITPLWGHPSGSRRCTSPA